jgi:hypothetical protein
MHREGTLRTRTQYGRLGPMPRHGPYDLGANCRRDPSDLGSADCRTALDDDDVCSGPAWVRGQRRPRLHSVEQECRDVGRVVDALARAGSATLFGHSPLSRAGRRRIDPDRRSVSGCTTTAPSAGSPTCIAAMLNMIQPFEGDGQRFGSTRKERARRRASRGLLSRSAFERAETVPRIVPARSQDRAS